MTCHYVSNLIIHSFSISVGLDLIVPCGLNRRTLLLVLVQSPNSTDTEAYVNDGYVLYHTHDTTHSNTRTHTPQAYTHEHTHATHSNTCTHAHTHTQHLHTTRNMQHATHNTQHQHAFHSHKYNTRSMPPVSQHIILSFNNVSKRHNMIGYLYTLHAPRMFHTLSQDARFTRPTLSKRLYCSVPPTYYDDDMAGCVDVCLQLPSPHSFSYVHQLSKYKYITDKKEMASGEPCVVGTRLGVAYVLPFL
jgi:hypothetical protein